MWPPIRSAARRARSRCTVLPVFRRPSVVRASVSAEASTSKPSPVIASTVRHAPFTAIDSPSASGPSSKRAVRARRAPGPRACLAASVPSFQAVYECDVHFEHCYALDQGGATVEAQKECWRDWLHGYTYGQSRDRVEYGGTRYSELSLDPTLPSEDSPSMRAKHIVAAPVPTKA